jgi:hypothetical protein
MCSCRVFSRKASQPRSHVARYPTRHGIQWRVLLACADGGRLAALSSPTVVSVSGWDDNGNAARSSHSQQWICRRVLTWGYLEWVLTWGTMCTQLGYSDYSNRGHSYAGTRVRVPRGYSSTSTTRVLVHSHGHSKYSQKVLKVLTWIL